MKKKTKIFLRSIPDLDILLKRIRAIERCTLKDAY